MSKALLFLAEGFEEVEAITPADFLRRAGIEVVLVGVGSEAVTGAHGITIEADITLEKLSVQDAENADALVIPGGIPGADNIAAEEKISSLITDFNRSGRLIAAICAAPAVVLGPVGVMDGKKATCYPGFESRFESGTVFSEDRVTEDGNLITSRGPGTAAEFSAAIIKRLEGAEAAESIRKGTLQLF